MLSRFSRVLVAISSALFAAIALVMYVFPRYAAAGFPWPISPLVSMTMGGWYLAAAITAFEAARRWRWPEVKGLLVFVWIFPILELAVVLVHHSSFDPLAELGTLYTGTLCIAALSGLFGFGDWLRVRPAATLNAHRMPWWLRVFALVFVALVGALGLYALWGVPRGGQVWPSVLQPLAVAAFGAFYLSLALAVLALVFDRSAEGIVALAQVGLLGIVLILVPAFLFIGRWDFVAKPIGLLYHGAYLLVGAVTVLMLMWANRRYRRPDFG